MNLFYYQTTIANFFAQLIFKTLLAFRDCLEKFCLSFIMKKARYYRLLVALVLTKIIPVKLLWKLLQGNFFQLQNTGAKRKKDNDWKGPICNGTPNYYSIFVYISTSMACFQQQQLSESFFLLPLPQKLLQFTTQTTSLFGVVYNKQLWLFSLQTFLYKWNNFSLLSLISSLLYARMWTTPVACYRRPCCLCFRSEKWLL